MQDYSQLKVWQKAHEFVLAVYRVTRAFPKDEQYGLTSQLRRSVASVPANIAEGCGRETPADLARFLQIARGSASETQYHLLLARDLAYITDEDHDRLNKEASEIRRMLSKLITRIVPVQPTHSRPVSKKS